ncbi:TonB-dependent receptor plug domain-containing protein [Mucilaginibacter sp. ZT4R22]|uniref:TonB-dependent receptor plug domain-containing protein n=1 Tax=Mucilaginibacter pankratovii TaxID=2772110 RepID=A0ABR7WTI7_9SPHI|nr:TonB-dependent receptor plug domain-containing protein [Mucilaginibacter pankratovii]MBD1365618.1 TonB-dependent receptor plug domain-containing protein [Mucilaginibacter pankratovii]
MKIFHRLLFLLCILCSTAALAQTDSSFLTKTVGNLKATYGAKPVEKVYLHLDKPNYIPGDTLWFKSYTVVGKTHALSALSGVLYVELISPRDSIVKRIVLRLTSGIALGDFALSGKLTPGNYNIRAYTAWMRNAGPDYFYNQRVNIGGISPGELAAPAAKLNPDVQFFPEGGEMVNGVRSKIAFKAVSQNGSGENIKGSIIDNEGTAVAEFESAHAGMGIFALLPQAGKAYSAKITLADGRAFTAPLPKALDAGYVLTVNNTRKDSLFIKVATNGQQFQAKQNTAFYLVGQSGGEVYYTAAGTLKTPVFGAGIDKRRFPSGIVQFTLFADGQPVNGRIVFVQSDDTLKMTLSSSVKTYAARSPVKLDFVAKNDANEPVAGSFSVAVINESRVGADENVEGSIFSHLLLTSDLKGYIEKPNYYFTNTTDAKRAELDILMLTQGYRRFEWKQILTAPDTRIVNQPEQSLTLEGTIKTTGGGIVPNGKLMLTATRENTVLDTVTDATGNFKFTNLQLSDTAKIVLQARKQNDGKRVAIYVKEPEYPNIIKSNAQEAANNDLSAEALRNSYAAYQNQLHNDSLKYGKQLSQVNITEKKLDKGDPYGAKRNVAGRTYNMKQYLGFPSMREVILNALIGYKMVGDVLIKAGKTGGPTDIFLDGSLVSVDNLYAYLPSEIESFKTGDVGDVQEAQIQKAYIVITTKRRAGTDTTVLKQVTITAKKAKKNVVTRSSNLHGAGNADQVLMGDQIGANCVNVSDCLRNKIFGVTFKQDGTPVNSRGGDMLIEVDGNRMPGSELNNINANDINSIEVLRSTFSKSIYGSDIGGGLLIITMKQGSERKFVTSESPTGLITYPFKGFYKARTYYTPKYTTANKNGGVLDLRSGIYWKPDVLTGKDGKATFDYFNADTKGTYRVVIEGIDDEGNLGRQVYRYKVE